MEVNEAIKTKINKLLYERNMSVNKLSTNAGLMQSTVDSILNGRSKNPTMVTICKICEGFDIPLSEFFDDKVFDNLDIDIK